MSTLREKRKKEKRERARRKTVDWTVVVGLAAVAVLCGAYFFYYHWSIRQQELEYERLRQAEAAVAETETEEVAETETETEESVVYCDAVYDFDELHEQNEDIYAWITVPGTQVDYPVLQSETANYYLDYNIDHSKGYPGCIYTNDCNTKDFSDYITVLYGHNMKNGTMFGSLHDFEDEEFFDEHSEIYVYTEENRLTYEIYATVKYNNSYIPANYAVNSATGRDEFLASFEEYMDESVAHVRDGAEVAEDDRLIVLSTCVSGQSDRRYLIVGVLREVAYYR